MRQSLGWLIHDEFGTDKDTIASISGKPLTRICLRSPGFQEFFSSHQVLSQEHTSTYSVNPMSMCTN